MNGHYLLAEEFAEAGAKHGDVGTAPENKLEFSRPIREAEAMLDCRRDAFTSLVKARRNLARRFWN